MTPEELKQILDEHKAWLADNSKGKRANLSDANLSDADLSGADLRWVNLRNANLYGADLYGANLRGADLRWVDLRWANLSGANLRNADLRWANLSGAEGITSFGPVGHCGRIGYAVKHDAGTMVQLVCFWGTEAEAVLAINEKYGSDSAYAALVQAACRVVKE